MSDLTEGKVVSIRSSTVEKNKELITEAADQIIAHCKAVLRLTGMPNATILAIDVDTGVTTHEIIVKTLEHKN